MRRSVLIKTSRHSPLTSSVSLNLQPVSVRRISASVRYTLKFWTASLAASSCLYILGHRGFASDPQRLPQVWIKLVSCSDTSTSLLLFLSSTQPAVSGCSDGDEESRRGQRHLAVSPSVPVVQPARHRVAPAETKLQTESGEKRFFLWLLRAKLTRC